MNGREIIHVTELTNVSQSYSESPFPFPIFEKKQKCDFTIPMAENCHSQAQHCNQSSRTRNEKTDIFKNKLTLLNLHKNSNKAANLKGHKLSTFADPNSETNSLTTKIPKEIFIIKIAKQKDSLTRKIPK